MHDSLQTGEIITTLESSDLSRGFGKRIYSVQSFRQALADVFEHLPDLQSASRRGLIDKAFSERIMLAVTHVNGCRYCSYGHARLALSVGISENEIKELLNGEFSTAPQEQHIALAFAEHYAETGGNPDSLSLQKLIETYGEEKTCHILAYIRMIMVGNLMGNTFDALLSRFRGNPAAGSSIRQELGVMGGSLILLPLGMLRRLLRRLMPRKA